MLNQRSIMIQSVAKALQLLEELDVIMAQLTQKFKEFTREKKADLIGIAPNNGCGLDIARFAHDFQDSVPLFMIFEDFQLGQ